MSVVVTNKFSDWSTQNMQRQLASADGYTEVSASLRVHRIRGSNVAVEWLLGDVRCQGPLLWISRRGVRAFSHRFVSPSGSAIHTFGAPGNGQGS